MKKLIIWEIIGALFVAVAGTLLHFTYEWSGYQLGVGFIAPVNESVWEHLKLLYFPSVLFACAEYSLHGRKFSGFLYAKSLGILMGLAFIIVFYFTYSGILGRNYLWMDIVSFLLAIAIQPLTVIRFVKSGRTVPWAYLAGTLLVLTLLAAFFVWFTISPPSIGLFMDPEKMMGPST